MALKRSHILFFSLMSTPHGHVGGTSLIRCPEMTGKGAVGSFFRQNQYECHPLLDLES